jgi:curli biogenesis system outer membrane secretion channel CsgG
MGIVLPRAAVGALGLLAVATSIPLGAQAPQAAPATATVAVMYFTNSALTNHEEYAPLSKGIADMLVTTLAGNPGIRVVERDQLQKVLEELNLNASDRIDKDAAVRLGKILGAHHLLMGGFVIDRKEAMRIDLRAVNVETSQVEYVESVSGKAENVLTLIADLGTKVNSGLKFPAMPGRSSPTKPTASTSAANQYRAFYLVSRSIEEQDKKNFSAAIALLRQAIDVYPDYARAKVRLAMLENSRGEVR